MPPLMPFLPNGPFDPSMATKTLHFASMPLAEPRLPRSGNDSAHFSRPFNGAPLVRAFVGRCHARPPALVDPSLRRSK